MNLRAQWRRLLITPLLIIVGFYFFLLGANYYYAGRAAYVLQRIEALKLDNSSVEELKRLGSERGLRYEASIYCAGTPCAYMVSPNNKWMRSLLRPPFLTRLAGPIGLRAWIAAADIYVEKGEVTTKGYALGLFNNRLDPEIQVSSSEGRHSEYDSCTYRPLKRHPGYEIHKASNIHSLRVIVSDDVSEENRMRAFQFNLNCLTLSHSCDQLQDLLPAAWADYQSDQEWVREHLGERDAQCE
jgi:hypothetical protein